MGPFYDHQVGRFDPPDPVKDRELLLARARRARAEAMADMIGTLWASLKITAGAVATFLRYAGAGSALRPPQSGFATIARRT